MKKRMFIMGDSISLHYIPFLKPMLDPWFVCMTRPEREAALVNLDKPTGSNGGDSYRVRELLEQQRRQGDLTYDCFLLNFGLHDIKTHPRSGERQVSMEDYRENLDSILALFQTQDIKLMWIRTTKVEDEIHNARSMEFKRYNRDVVLYNEIADQRMRENGVPVIDLYTFTETFGPDAYYDHVHFNEEVQRAQAAFIAGNVVGWNNTNFL